MDPLCNIAALPIRPTEPLSTEISRSPSHLPPDGYLIPMNKPSLPGLKIGEFLVIGRDASCGLVISDELVCPRHARIERKSQGFIIRDLHSKNGTYLNESRMAEALLKPFDRIRFGETIFVVSELPQMAPALSSKNLEWKNQLDRLPSFSLTEFPVLIMGPSGAGKEIIANAIHERSTRRHGPFVSINCSALSESLIESELFGHVRGSFTGATHDRKGAFETARSGTLFLDEIGDLPLSLQPKLLRALENSEIRPVGSDRAVETDVRIIAATHKNLNLNVQQKKFREDLFYRLNVCQIQPPSLIDRMEDFDDLIYHFAKQLRVRFSFTAIERLKEHSWPGNVRELKNTVARASAYFPGKHIQPEDLPSILGPVLPGADGAINQPNPTDTQNAGAFSGSLMKEFEREMIIRRLVANQGNQRRTANDLGMPKSTLHDRIKSYSIDPKQLDIKQN